MRFSFPLTERQAAWTATLTFTIVGFLIAFVLPDWVAKNQGADETLPILYVLGGVFFVLGSVGVLWMCGDLVLGRVRPALQDKWFWWGNFLLGCAGALVFAIPAILVLPAMVLYPSFFPSNDSSENFWLGVLFFVTGLLTLIALFFIGRAKYRERP